MNARKIVLAIAVIAVLASVAVVSVYAAGQYMDKPVRGTFKVTQEFSSSSHSGMDIAPISSDAWYVYAPSDGVVDAVRTGSFRGDTAYYGAGNFIVIRHSPGDWNLNKGYRPSVTYTIYYHLSEVKVGAGQQVKQGQLIGIIGNTGNTIGTTGYHLHFEIRENGRYGTPVNPREYIHFGDGKDLPFLV